MKTKASV